MRPGHVSLPFRHLQRCTRRSTHTGCFNTLASTGILRRLTGCGNDRIGDGGNDGRSPALAHSAAGHAEHVAQHPQERRIAVDIDGPNGAVDLDIVGDALPRSVIGFRLTRCLQHLFQLFERFGVLRADWGIVAAGIRSLQSTNHTARNREGSATMVAFAHEVPLRMGCTVTSKAVPAKSIDDIDGPSFAN